MGGFGKIKLLGISRQRRNPGRTSMYRRNSQSIKPLSDVMELYAI